LIHLNETDLLDAINVPLTCEIMTDENENSNYQ